MLKFREDELKDITKEIERDFIEKGEFLKVIRELDTYYRKELNHLRDYVFELEKIIFELKRELDLLKSELKQENVLEFRKISKDAAKELIRDYVLKNPGCLTSEIIENLKLDPELVVQILKELEEEGVIEGRE